jgi:hypothetical protein
MAYKYPTYKLNSDGTFGPTTRKHKYKPVYYHNKSAKKNEDKNKWCKKQNEQYEIFRIADENIWECSENSALFSIIDNGKEIFGSNEERLAIFRIPPNKIDDWHGYPFLSSEYQISEDLLDLWEANKVIDDRIRRKIAKGEL